MDESFINLTRENLAEEHLCCIIRTKKPHPGVEAKRQWLAQRLDEGHVFRKLNVKGTAFIEYAPLESAWTPIVGDRWMYVYCLWVDGEWKGKGYGGELLTYCLNDARARGMAGVCLLGADKQKHWLTSQAFFKRRGFEAVDTAPGGYELLALSFDGTKPRFSQQVKRGTIDATELTVYYDYQCPYMLQYIEGARQYCEENGIAASFHLIDTLEKAKALPCVFNNCAVFYQGRFQTVNLPDLQYIQRLLARGACTP